MFDSQVPYRAYPVTIFLLAGTQRAVPVSDLATVRRLATRVVGLTELGTANLPPDRIDTVVTKSADLVPGTTCLSAAIVAEALLEAQGERCELRIAVRKDGEELAAHAWVETEDQTLISGDVDLDEYEILVTGELLSYPGERADDTAVTRDRSS